MAKKDCPQCEGTGWKPVEVDGVRQVARFGRTDQLFPVSFDPAIFLGAAAAAVAATMVAAVLPARRAARMDPVEIIHGN